MFIFNCKNEFRDYFYLFYFASREEFHEYLIYVYLFYIAPREEFQNSPTDYERVVELAEILVKYEARGVVETLEGHECMGQTRPPEDYLPCAIDLQAVYCHRHRHCYLLSGKYCHRHRHCYLLSGKYCHRHRHCYLLSGKSLCCRPSYATYHGGYCSKSVENGQYLSIINV